MGLNIKPLADRVLIEPAAAEEKHCRWNHYSGYRKRKTTKRKSTSSWHGKPDEPMTVNVGDTVLYGKYCRN